MTVLDFTAAPWAAKTAFPDTVLRWRAVLRQRRTRLTGGG